MIIYSRYNTPVVSGLVCPEPTRTQQHLKNECDINMIIERAIRTGNNEVFTTTERGEYYDVSSYVDYQRALDFIDGVDDDFHSLPSSIRKEFGNDAEKYVAFMANPANHAKAVELGLLTPVGGNETTPPASEQPSPSDPSGDPPEA